MQRSILVVGTLLAACGGSSAQDASGQAPDFKQASATLRLEVSGGGEVTATGQLTGSALRCRGAENAPPVRCTGEFAAREQVLLQAAADADFEFLSWHGGECTTIGDCAVALDAGAPAVVAAGVPPPAF